MKKILIVSGHTDLNISLANKTILEEISKLMPDAEIACLDKLYPGFKIDIQAEQERLTRAEIIVLQYPIHWYSASSLLHRWLEQVLTYGFAYGQDGDKIKGKPLILSFTSGSPEEAYRYGGYQGYPIKDFLPGYKQLAILCGLKWEGYIYTGGFSFVSRDDIEKTAIMKEKAIKHAHRLAEKLKNLNI